MRAFGAFRSSAQIGAGIRVPVESSPDEIASALLELLTRPSYRKAAQDTAAAIARDKPDETAAAALSDLGQAAAR